MISFDWRGVACRLQGPPLPVMKSAELWQHGAMLRLVVLAVVGSSCSQMMMTVDGGAGGGRGGGGAGGGAAGAFTVVELDANARGLFSLAMAVDPADGRVVVAYFTPRNTQTVMDVEDLNLNVVEWRNGVTTPPQTIRFMQRAPGVAIALHPTTKEPTVAFMGGPDRFEPNGPSVFWFQHDASLATRSGTMWTDVAARTTGDVCTNVGAPMNGSVVGLFPALRFDAMGRVVFAYRDIRFAQFITDYTGSDLESMEGTLGALTPRCVFEGFNTKPGIGGRLMMVAGPNDETVLVADQNVTGADTVGQDVVLMRRTATGWTAPTTVLSSGDTQTGPQVAWDPMLGYAVAVVRGSILAYRQSANASTWENEETVVSEGSGGWYPSLAIDPVSHEPSLAYYACSRSSGVAMTNCQTSQDALRVVSRGGGRWQTPVTVDEEGGWSPKLGFFATGKRVIAYRVANTADGSARAGVLKLAIER
ncbi:MAG: hypothetical protein Q8N26_33390 [Myxococcales bacterium]|nr:hypothetical protein [Myxococcales bacterium]